MANVFNPINLPLQPQEILRYAGYHHRIMTIPKQNPTVTTEDTIHNHNRHCQPPPSFTDRTIQDRLQQVIEQSSLYLQPTCLWETYPYNDQQILANTQAIPLHSESIIHHLCHCHQVTVLAVTVGQEVENHVSRLFEQGEYLTATLFDALATAAVEQAADQLQQHLQLCAQRTKSRLTTRFSPGYGNWDVSAQQLFRQLLPLDQINIQINSHFQLIPRKSITALVGWYNQQQTHPPTTGCVNCNLRHCAYRNQKEDSLPC